MGPDQEVIFEEEQITLDIPKEGIVLESGWTITPFTYPGVSELIFDFSYNETQIVENTFVMCMCACRCGTQD